MKIKLRFALYPGAEGSSPPYLRVWELFGGLKRTLEGYLLLFPSFPHLLHKGN